jgi:hypothetical protein
MGELFRGNLPQSAAQLAEAKLSQAVTDSSTTSAPIVQQPVGLLGKAKKSQPAIVQVPLAQISAARSPSRSWWRKSEEARPSHEPPKMVGG